MILFKKLCTVSVLLACTTTLSAQNGIRFEQHTENVVKDYEGGKGLTQEQKDEIERRIKEQVEAQRRRKQEEKSETQGFVSAEESDASSNTNNHKENEAERRRNEAIAAEERYEARKESKYEQRDREFESRRNMSEENRWAADVGEMQRDMNSAKAYTPARANTGKKNEQEKIRGRDLLSKSKADTQKESEAISVKKYERITKYEY